MNNPLTVKSLLDVVGSQLCIYGNQSLFIKGDIEYGKSFLLFAGSGVEHQILECLNYEGRCIENGLKPLVDILLGLDGNEVIYCSDDDELKNKFTIGFKSSVDGFVETISSDELIQQTEVN